MRILCPMCGFGREIDEAKIPSRAQMATCPKCSHKFRFRVVDDVESLSPDASASAPPPAGAGPAAPLSTTGVFSGGQDLSASQPDPMAAQRAAAAEAWKRLQGQPAPRADEAAAPAPPAAPPSTPDQQPAAANADTGAWLPPGGNKGAGSPVPFEDLPRFGFFPGLWGTIRQALTGPTAFFRSMPVTGGMGKPLAFHLLLAEFMVVCQYVWSLLGFGAAAQYLGSAELMDLGLGMAGAAPVLLLLLVYPLLLVFRLMLMTGIIHLLLRLVRSGEAGAEATFRVLCYSAAPLLLGIIPGFGPLLGGVWSIGLTIIGLKAAHRTRLSMAMFAVLVPILLMLAAVLGLLQGMAQPG